MDVTNNWTDKFFMNGKYYLNKQERNEMDFPAKTAIQKKTIGSHK